MNFGDIGRFENEYNEGVIPTDCVSFDCIKTSKVVTLLFSYYLATAVP